jgi:hypothetical protein
MATPMYTMLLAFVFRLLDFSTTHNDFVLHFDKDV